MTLGTRLGAAAAALGVVVIVYVSWQRSRVEDTAGTVPPLPPPLVAAAKNARRDVAYVGATRCRECHPEAHESWLRTHHSRALGPIELAHEPPDGTFDDPRSLRRYRVYRKGEQLRQEESISLPGDESLVLADHPMAWVMGSGHYSRTYLIERDGFFFEAPATWYTAKAGWGLSPGYETYNPGFSRPVEFRCVTCHAGRAEPLEQSPHRVTIHSQAIDCERCHGPGELHAARWQNRSGPELSGPDDTIVHPARLDRGRREDLCAQCHLHSAATVELRGRRLQDFRPGERLADYLVHYGAREPDQAMAVVGHVEQMRLSRCWQASGTLTCTTCHNLHGEAEATATSRAICAACHNEGSCGLAPDVRRKRQGDNDCLACHMPKSPTDIPHFAFTHHRIGIHEPDKRASTDAQLSDLVPLGEALELSDRDQKRNLGLAYLQFSDTAGQAPFAAEYHDRARRLLEPLVERSAADPEVHAALARLAWRSEPSLAGEHAQKVLAGKDASPEALATALFVLAMGDVDANRLAEARPTLERVARMRPTADVWRHLSDARHATGDLEGALDAARRAASVAPDWATAARLVAERLAQSGRTDEARQWQSRGAALDAHRRQLDRRSSR